MSDKTILVAPDSYKGCLSSEDVGKAMERGIKRACKDTDVIRFSASDGGEGFCECMRGIFGGRMISREVTFPDSSRGTASYLYCAETRSAYVELAAASGLTLTDPRKRDVLTATTLGTGELIKDAVLRGAEHVTVGLGGSATNDCGMGILHALGCRFYDVNGLELFPCGASLIKTKSADLVALKEYKNIRFTAACDVVNPLCGKNGAAYVFAPQKGADEAAVISLDKGMLNFAELTGIEIASSGAGAAGGCGGALISLLGAEYVGGAKLLTGSHAFSLALERCSAVFTGEGKTDSQTACGKLVAVIAEIAAARGKPVYVISGAVEDGVNLRDKGVSGCFPVTPRDMDIEEAYRRAEELVADTAENVMRILSF
ncbi:MAG: glycerate kinase [Clostridia bacterium]|nr:glycerate kinase [Clostridia bacterium]